MLCGVCTLSIFWDLLVCPTAFSERSSTMRTAALRYIVLYHGVISSPDGTPQCFMYWRRMPSNLRLLTHKCMNLVMCGHVRSRHKDGNHTIQSVIAKSPMIHANLMALCIVEPELWLIEVLHCVNRDFRLLLLWPWPWPNDLHDRTWPVFPSDTPDVQIWTFYIKAFERYCLTDRQTRP